MNYSVVKAEQSSGDYYRVIDDETPFFADQDMNNLLFYLPYTYYVKLLDVADNVAHVECYGDGDTLKIDGYTYFDSLFYDDLLVASPYLNLSILTAKTTVLYLDVELSSPIQFVFPDRSLNYYGYINTDSGYVLCVGYNGYIGYVSENDVVPFIVPVHPNELTFIKPDTPIEVPIESGDNAVDTVFKAIIIGCLILAGVIGLLIALRKQKSPDFSRDYYEEKDYE